MENILKPSCVILLSLILVFINRISPCHPLNSKDLVPASAQSAQSGTQLIVKHFLNPIITICLIFSCIINLIKLVNVFSIGTTYYPTGTGHNMGAGASLLLFFLGIFLRIWSKKTLGRFYTRQVAIRENHVLITHGPYKYMRHPAYFGISISFFSLAIISTLTIFEIHTEVMKMTINIDLLLLSLPSWIAFILTVLCIFHRIGIEETWLIGKIKL